MAAVALTTGKQGINRYRIKGGAKPDTLYDAVNCYITVAGSARPRPGTVIDEQLPDGTVGLMAYRGRLWVFSDHYIDMSAHPGYGMSVLTHPNEEGGTAPTLVRVHFAEPFLGYPYVVAEWSDGAIYHYWLQGEGDNPKVWEPNTTYELGEVIHPTTPNGWTYKANRLGPPGTPWAPRVERALNDVVEPTTPNGYEYVAVEVHGNPPRSGDVEPKWIAKDGAIVVEEADTAPNIPPPPANPPPPSLPPGTDDRYGGINDSVQVR